MLLIHHKEWVEKYFAEGSRPAEITVLRWLRKEDLPGRKVGGTWFVDEHAWLAGEDELMLRVLEAG